MNHTHESTGGVSSVFVNGRLCVYGGPVPDKVWQLDVQDFTWDEMQCHGDIPAARHHHAVCTYKDRMLIHGGMLLEGGHEEHPVYSMDVLTGNWTHILTSGEAPTTRSHHTAVVIDDMMVIYGGRCCADNPTAQELEEQKRAGFFDVHVLNLQQLRWFRIERYDPLAPMLWGHSASVFRHFMIVFGGFDVSESPPASIFADVSTTPVATLSNTVFIYDTQRCEWKKASPHPGQACPVPRALHAAHNLGAQMVVYGGITVDNNGRPTNVLDAWVWDISSGNWTPFSFALSYWSGKKPLGAVLPGSTALMVANNQTEVHFYTLSTGTWQTQICDPAKLYKPTVPIDYEPPQPQPPPFKPEPEPEPEPEPQVPVSMPSVTTSPLDTGPLPLTETAQPQHLYEEHTYPVHPELVPEVHPYPSDPYAEERRRNHMVLVQQEEKKRTEQVGSLRERILEMQDQLNHYRNMQHEQAQPRHSVDHPEISPQRNTTYAIPATAKDADAQDAAGQYMSQLMEQFTQVQHQNRRSLDEAHARHRAQMEEARRLHEERLRLIKQQQQEYQDAQLELAQLETKHDNAEVLRKQTELLQEQQRQLAEVQKVVPPVEEEKPRQTSGLPTQVRSMAAAVDKLTKASELRGPSVTTAFPRGMEEVAGIQNAIKQMNTAFIKPAHIDNRVPSMLSPSREASFSPVAVPNHLQNIKNQIARINRTTREESERGFSKRVSPPRLRHASVN